MGPSSDSRDDNKVWPSCLGERNGLQWGPALIAGMIADLGLHGHEDLHASMGPSSDSRDDWADGACRCDIGLLQWGPALIAGMMAINVATNRAGRSASMGPSSDSRDD